MLSRCVVAVTRGNGFGVWSPWLGAASPPCPGQLCPQRHGTAHAPVPMSPAAVMGTGAAGTGEPEEGRGGWMGQGWDELCWRSPVLPGGLGGMFSLDCERVSGASSNFVTLEQRECRSLRLISSYFYAICFEVGGTGSWLWLCTGHSSPALAMAALVHTSHGVRKHRRNWPAVFQRPQEPKARCNP